MTPDPAKPVSRAQAQAVATSFLALFSISGLGFYGLSFFFDFMVRERGWTLLQVTSRQRIRENSGRAPLRLRRRMDHRSLRAAAADDGRHRRHGSGALRAGLDLDARGLLLLLYRGYTQAQAAGVVSMVGMASLGGRLFVGWCADRFAKKHVMLMVYLLVALALPLLYASSSFVLALVFAVIFGVAAGGDYLMIPLMAAELFGVRVLGRLLGIVLTADGIAEALAPMLVGYLRDVTKSYAAGFGVLIGLALVGALAVAMLPRKASLLPEPARR